MAGEIRIYWGSLPSSMHRTATVQEIFTVNVSVDGRELGLKYDSPEKVRETINSAKYKDPYFNDSHIFFGEAEQRTQRGLEEMAGEYNQSAHDTRIDLIADPLPLQEIIKCEPVQEQYTPVLERTVQAVGYLVHLNPEKPTPGFAPDRGE